MQKNIIQLARQIWYLAYFERTNFPNLGIWVSGLFSLTIEITNNNKKHINIGDILGRSSDISGAYIILIRADNSNTDNNRDSTVRSVHVRKTTEPAVQLVCEYHNTKLVMTDNVNPHPDILEYVQIVLEMIAGETEFEMSPFSYSTIY